MPRTAEGRDAMGEADKEALRVGLDGSLKLEFHVSATGPVTATVSAAGSRDIAVAIPPGRGRVRIAGGVPQVQVL